MTNNLYSFDMRVVATAYVKAESQRDALRKLRDFKLAGIEVTGINGDLPISGLPYDSPDLPEISLSPAMTIYGPLPGSGDLVANGVGKPDDL